MDTVGLTDTKWALDIAAKPVINANQDTRKGPPGTTQWAAVKRENRTPDGYGKTVVVRTIGQNQLNILTHYRLPPILP